MTKLSKEASEFLMTEWDVRDWSEKQRVQWQEKCFELGFSWPLSGKTVSHTGRSFYYFLGYGDILHGFSTDTDFTLKQFEDMFPAKELLQEDEKLDVVSEILELVNQRKQEVEEGVVQENPSQEGTGFENLTYHCPKHLTDEYLCIDVCNLSSAQKEFLVENLEWSCSVSSEELLKLQKGFLNLCSDGRDKWFFSPCKTYVDTEIFFNTIYKEK